MRIKGFKQNFCFNYVIFLNHVSGTKILVSVISRSRIPSIISVSGVENSEFDIRTISKKNYYFLFPYMVEEHCFQVKFSKWKF